MSIIFRSSYSPRVRFQRVIHRVDEGIYEERINSKGARYLVCTGRKDVNSMIQEQLPSTLVYNLLSRFSNGDVNALLQRPGSFFDTTGMPTSLSEAYNLMLGIESKFASLPLELREQFGNSSVKFGEALQNGSLNDILAKLYGKNAQNGGNPGEDKIGEDSQKKEVK
jgi:hypothetical protein